MSAPTVEPGLDGRVPPRPARPSRRRTRAVLAAAVALGVAAPIFAGVFTFPVESVRISGEFVRVSKADIERAVEPLLVPGLVRVDVDAIRRAALDIPGVREATVRRVWPDRLEISVTERTAVARWAGGGFLEPDGTHFVPTVPAPPDPFPVLAGPEGSQHRVLDLHNALGRVLAPLGMSVVATGLDPRGVLHATLREGPRLVMRPEAIGRHVGACARALDQVTAGRLHEVERVDLRYPGGFAVRMKGDAAGDGGRG